LLLLLAETVSTGDGFGILQFGGLGGRTLGRFGRRVANPAPAPRLGLGLCQYEAGCGQE